MKKALRAIALALLPIIPASAQTLTIDQCVRLARENYPVVAQYGIIEKLSDLNLANETKSWLPQGNANAQVSWQNDVATLPAMLTNILTQNGVDYPGLEKTQYRVGIDLSQQIWDGGKVKANKNVIATASATDKASIDVQLYDVEGRVEDLYFSLLLQKERIVRTDKSIALLDSTLRQAKSMLANGTATQSDCDQIEAGLLTLHQQRTRLSAQNRTLGQILEIFIGEPIGAREIVLPAEDVGQSADMRPQMRLFDSMLANIDAREAQLKVANMPTIGAFASGYYGYPGLNMFKNMQSRDMSFNFIAGVKISWNFSTLYTRRNSLNKLALQRDKVEADRATFNFNNDIAIKEYLGQISSLNDLILNDRRIVELRQSVRKAAQSQLRNGIIDATTFLSKITDEELAENDMAQHRIELVKAMYNLNHLKNK